MGGIARLGVTCVFFFLLNAGFSSVRYAQRLQVAPLSRYHASVYDALDGNIRNVWYWY